jgi:Flp pilus assembly protein TadG
MVIRCALEVSQPRRGGVTPLVVLSLALLVGVVALVIDGGTLLEERRHVQGAADAAALAAAADLYANYAANQGTDPSSTASASALATAAANGFSNDGVTSVVTVNLSPQNYQSGPHAGTKLPAGYAEVIIQYNAARTFSNFFGSGALPVTARAVARGQWTSVSDDVIALNLTAASTVSLSGGSSLNLAGSLRVNSSSSLGLSVLGGGSITASQFNINKAVGSLLGLLLALLNGVGGTSPTVNYLPPIADPLRSLPAPNAVSLGLTNQGTNIIVNTGATVDLYPGVYTGGITVSGGSTAVLHANSDGTPGIYFLQGGGLTVSGPSSVSMAVGETAGVMIYNAWGSTADTINIAGSGTLTLTPPSSGVYQGISIFQKRGTKASHGPDVTISGQGTANVAGTIYSAYAKVALSSSGAANVMGGQVIADTLSLTGGATININRGTQPVARTRTLNLVE